MGLKHKDLLSIHDLSVGEVATILDVAKKLKKMQKNGVPHEYCKGKTLAMLFSKASTRTRVSFETGFHQLLRNQRISADLGFGESLLKQLQSIATSNFSQKRLTDELTSAYNYEVLPVDHPEGEYAVGEDGFMEFHMKEGAAAEWVLEHLYTEMK